MSPGCSTGKVWDVEKEMCIDIDSEIEVLLDIERLFIDKDTYDKAKESPRDRKYVCAMQKPVNEQIICVEGNIFPFEKYEEDCHCEAIGHECHFTDCDCNNGQIWDGKQCRCPKDEVWNGNQCTTSTSSPLQ